ncbi:topoisomerase C-terminal repeat-containing protein, partial [Coprococcus eutactus]|uniref:topoisomerase C-terminal repeat-containing protein n=1 Tax=Coprococcus eutactus TaxID=33043 RepID=UPI00210CEED9
PDALTMEEAIALLAAKASGAPAGGGRVVGQYPGHGDIVARDGRYGAYVSLGKVNATLPDGMTPDTVSLEDA